MNVARAPEQAAQVVAPFGRAVPPGAPLTVSPGESALFARNGQIVRVIEAGSYQVPAEYAGDGVEVCFVRTSPVTGAKFGGPTGPIPGTTARNVFGTFSYRVASPATLVQSLLGWGGGDEAIEQFLRHELLRAFKHALGAHGTDPAAHGRVVSDVVGGTRDLERFGLALVGIEYFQAR
jgi:membrane protease subunit (stomatin/prohibitin family)